jgi:glycosyltransferase involved in cell wall biosynthesis
MKKKVLWITNIPSPYRVNFLNLFGESCELKVIFERRQSDERNEDWYGNNFDNFDYVFLKGFKYKADRSISLSVTKYINRDFDFIFISNPMTPTGIIATSYMKIFKIPFVIEGDGAFIKTNESRLKFKLKRFFLSGAKNYFSTGEAHKNYYQHYGVKEDVIIWYPFSSVLEKDIAKRPPNQTEKNVLKKKYNLDYATTILFVGQFIERKGVDILLEIVENFKKPIQVLLIGGNSTQLSNIFNKKINNNIKVIEFLNPMQLKDFYDLSDLFILPTREDIWGLVVNEAMARGLPVITTLNCGAGLELVENGINGFIFDIKNYISVTKFINELIENSDLRKNMGQANIKKAKLYSINQTANYHIEYINGI